MRAFVLGIGTMNRPSSSSSSADRANCWGSNTTAWRSKRMVARRTASSTSPRATGPRSGLRMSVQAAQPVRGRRGSCAIAVRAVARILVAEDAEPRRRAGGDDHAGVGDRVPGAGGEPRVGGRLPQVAREPAPGPRGHRRAVMPAGERGQGVPGGGVDLADDAHVVGVVGRIERPPLHHVLPPVPVAARRWRPSRSRIGRR